MILRYAKRTPRLVDREWKDDGVPQLRRRVRLNYEGELARDFYHGGGRILTSVVVYWPVVPYRAPVYSHGVSPDSGELIPASACRQPIANFPPTDDSDRKPFKTSVQRTFALEKRVASFNSFRPRNQPSLL